MTDGEGGQVRIERLRRGEAAGRARYIVAGANEAWYARKKEEFSSVQDVMYITFLKQGEILSEMRNRSSGFIVRLAHETGDTEEKLNTLADFYEYFSGREIRQDIDLRYYLIASKSLRLIAATWAEVSDDVAVAAAEEAAALIKDADPLGGESPRVVAERLERRFGITDKGNKPFSRLEVRDPEGLMETFHESIRPAFKEFLARLAAPRERPAPPAVSAKKQGHPSVPKRFTLIVNLTAKGKMLDGDDMEKVLEAVNRALSELDLPDVEYVPYFMGKSR